MEHDVVSITKTWKLLVDQLGSAHINVTPRWQQTILQGSQVWHWRDHFALQHEDRLDETRKSGARLGMTNIRLDRAQI